MPSDAPMPQSNMLLKIVQNDYNPKKDQAQPTELDNKDWAESALFEYAYTKTQNDLVKKGVLVPTDCCYTQQTQSLDENLK